MQTNFDAKIDLGNGEYQLPGSPFKWVLLSDLKRDNPGLCLFSLFQETFAVASTHGSEVAMAPLDDDYIFYVTQCGYGVNRNVPHASRQSFVDRIKEGKVFVPKGWVEAVKCLLDPESNARRAANAARTQSLKTRCKLGLAC